jgi:hypothetical protein
VRAFAELLTSRGAAVWLDEWRVHAGEPIQEAMEQGLRSCDTIALIVNRDNVHLPNLFFELGAAVAMGPDVIGMAKIKLDTRLMYFHSCKTLLVSKSSHFADPGRAAGRAISCTSPS